MISRRMARTLEKLQNVRVIPKKDLSFDRLGIKLFKDVEAEVPRWLAEILHEENLVEVENIDHKTVSEKLYKEKVSITPLELPSYTYSLIREVIRSSPEDSLIRRDAVALVSRRVGKILNHLRTSLTLTTRRPPKNLLPEEIILYNALRLVVDGWMNAFLGIRDDE
ncbi:MAG TPA: hypothetical protein ENF57_01110 [Candidatus Korarchaeota archaeon]|nr:hypothetical protein [Candidatus Korarchaeota archaeon]